MAFGNSWEPDYIFVVCGNSCSESQRRLKITGIEAYCLEYRNTWPTRSAAPWSLHQQMAAARPSAALYQKTKLPDIGGAAARACCLLWRSQTQASGRCGVWLPFSMVWKWWWLAVTATVQSLFRSFFQIVVYDCFTLPGNYLLWQLFLLADIFAGF